MKTKLTTERGLSLVEVTIMLLVLMLLTGVLAPSIFDYVKDAQWVKVKEDCEAIGVSVARLTRDVGPCLKFTGTGQCTKDNRVDILFSDGPDVGTDSLTGDASNDFYSDAVAYGHMNWWKASWHGDSMERQFVTNEAGYLTPAQSFPGAFPVGPQFGLGWRGAYLASPIGPDPWGHRYMVNATFLSVANDVPGTGEGQSSGGWSNDTFCISAGPNGLYETAYGGNGHGGVARQGDDFIYIISGDTR